MKKPKTKKRTQFRVFDSMDAAAGALGLSKETLKAAKAAKDCTAFHNSRVDEKELLEWLSKQPAEIKTQLNLKDEKLTEEIRKLQILNDREEGGLLLASSVGPALRNVAMNQRLALQRVLENQLPERLLGKTIPEMSEELRKAADQICDEFREGLRAWMEAPPQVSNEKNSK